MTESITVGFLYLISIPLLLWVLMDLPNLIMGNHVSYQGECEVWYVDEGKLGNKITVYTNAIDLSFAVSELGEDGVYFCQLEYLPNTQIGTKLKLVELIKEN